MTSSQPTQPLTDEELYVMRGAVERADVLAAARLVGLVGAS